jgi:DNA-binding NarL/FixJ family response regulator
MTRHAAGHKPTCPNQERNGTQKASARLSLTFRLLFADNISGGPGTHMALTRRQKQVYDFISGFVDKHGYSPSFEEIAEGLGLSSLATVHKHITNLEQKEL